MRHMGVAALYPKRRTSAPGRGHKVYPYLLTGVSVERANVKGGPKLDHGGGGKLDHPVAGWRV